MDVQPSTVSARLYAELRSGATVRAACRAAGLWHTTLYNWLKRGEQGIEPFARFRTHFGEALADGANARVAAANAEAERIEQSAIG